MAITSYLLPAAALISTVFGKLAVTPHKTFLSLPRRRDPVLVFLVSVFFLEGFGGLLLFRQANAATRQPQQSVEPRMHQP